MLTRMKLLNSYISYLPLASLHEYERLQVDAKYNLPVECIKAVSDAVFRNQLNEAQPVYNHIFVHWQLGVRSCKDAYFLHDRVGVLMPMCNHPGIREEEKLHLKKLSPATVEAYLLPHPFVGFPTRPFLQAAT